MIRNDNVSPDMLRVAGFQHTENEAASVAEILAPIIPKMLMKKSGKWPNASHFSRERLGETLSRVISFCDREADILSYIQDKQKHNERFVIRAKHSRIIENSDEKRFEHLEAQPILGAYSIDIAQKGMKTHKGKAINRAAKKAKLTVKVASVTLNAKDGAKLVNVIYAQEKTSATVTEPLRWILLTTEPIETFKASPACH